MCINCSFCQKNKKFKTKTTNYYELPPTFKDFKHVIFIMVVRNYNYDIYANLLSL